MGTSKGRHSRAQTGVLRASLNWRKRSKRAVGRAGTVEGVVVTHVRKPHPGRSRVAASLVLLLAMFGSPATAPIAHAMDADSAFLESLDSVGIKYTSPEKAVAAGHYVCQLLDQGKTKGQVAARVMIRNVCPSSCIMDPYLAGYFVGASVSAYCPEYQS